MTCSYKRLTLCIALLAKVSAATAAPPLAASGVFVSHNYAFTFRAPLGLTYCRLADGWTGSDHGTVVFLSPPRDCDGAGYPSSSRGFTPPETPRIEVYYGHWDRDGPRQAACRSTGWTRFLGHERPVCKTRHGNARSVEVIARYTADSSAEAIVTLVTPSARLRRDLPVWRALVASAAICSEPWRDAEGKAGITGSGRPCPAEGEFY